MTKLTVVEQAGVLHKPGSRRSCIIQVPDGMVDEQVQAYVPGLYILSSRSYAVDRFGHLALRFKLYLDEIEMDPDTANGPEQPTLFADREIIFGPTFRVRSRRWIGH
ncbi:MAG TPA: single-stranded DNA-binding protein [Rudaea sp.]